jgi:dihydroneopterin aldolase
VEPSTPLTDCICVEQLEVFARVGVTESERAGPQRLTVTIVVWPEKSFGDLKDDITQAVNYSALAAVTRDFVSKNSYNLIETLVTQLAARLLEAFPIRRIQLELRKFVLPGANYVAVTVTREAATS